MFGDDIGAKICGIGSVSFDGKHHTSDVYYVKGLRDNLLSIGHMCRKRYDLVFKDEKYEIRKGSKILIAIGKISKGNIYQLKGVDGRCFMTQINDSWLWNRRTCHMNF